MSGLHWLKNCSFEQKNTIKNIITCIFTNHEEINNSLSRNLLEKSWAVICLDCEGMEIDIEKMLDHLGGELFMNSLALNGDILLVSRRQSSYETGSDEHTEGANFLNKLEVVQERMDQLSDICLEIKPMFVKEMALQNTF